MTKGNTMNKNNMDKIKIDKHNYRKHDERNKELIKKSLSDCGAGRSILIDSEDEIIAGNGIYEQAQALNIPVKIIETDGSELIAVKRTDLRTEDEKRKQLAVMDNSTSDSSKFDVELLNADFDIGILNDWGIDIKIQNEETDNLQTQRLSEKFLIPPFDIFNARSGEWLNRKKMWNSLINDNAQARENATVYSSFDKEKYNGTGILQKTSILDPVLSEIINLWFLPYKNCNTFDCFAGDTVFGYVSSYLGNNFTGIELRQEQADFNNEHTKGMSAKYICDDGQNVCNHIEAESQDLLFSCPPYFDLEVYSDLENDASNQDSYEDFLKILDNAFTNAIKCLKNNRFAVIVVGDVRDKKTGAYYNFPNDIINIFNKNGLILYNNIKLLTPIGTAQVRAGKYMQNRKTVHVYQDVLVFYKGDTKKIKDNFGEVEVKEIESADV